MSANNRRRKDIYKLPQSDQEVLESLGYKQKLDEVDNAIRANAEFLKLIVESPEIFGHDLEADAEESVPHDNDQTTGLFLRSPSF